MTAINWTRIKNDVNGNPRYVCHFLNLITSADSDVPLLAKYPLAVSRANRIGGRRYHCKAYGGGIVFQSYSLEELEQAIQEALLKIDPTHRMECED